jgi:hypothetical protein
MEVTAVMKSAAGIMCSMPMFDPFLKVEYLSGPIRGVISELYPIGPLVVKTKLKLEWFDKTFEYVISIHYQTLEDICMPMGDLTAKEFLWSIFKEDITKSGIYADWVASQILSAEINKLEK